MRHKGLIERLVWIEGKSEWNVASAMPSDQCNGFGYCSTFGICNINEASCVVVSKGFEPNSPENWNLRDSKDGCK